MSPPFAKSDAFMRPRMRLIRVAFVSLGIAIGISSSANSQTSGELPVNMVRIPSGSYRPLYTDTNVDGSTSSAKLVEVSSFLMDRFPVTNREYLAFVQANPLWKRSGAPAVFVDRQYLKHWKSDEVLGDFAPEQSPVTHVSWFAAKAYCAWVDKKLPTVNQWEYVAQADETRRDATRDPQFSQRIISWYSKPTPSVMPPVGSGVKNLWGVHELHGLVWEWTLDFNTALVSGESRGDSALERKFYCGAGALNASDFKDYAAFMRFAFRSSLSANYAIANLGFRCVKPISSSN